MDTIAHVRVLEQLPPGRIMTEQGKLRALFSKALGVGQGEVEADDILQLALENRLYVFGGYRDGELVFALAMEFYVSPQKKWLHATAYAGEARWFWDCLPDLKVWGKMNGASEIRGFGGEAQMRLARRHGFKEIYRVYSMEI
jgi:hypothetical protein